MNDNCNFLEKATALFMEHGAKTLTMDDVAREFGMSKKTLYQRYKNKEALLEDVLKFKLDQVIAKFRKLDADIKNPIERMFCRDEQIEAAAENNKSLLLRQLIKYYPAIFGRHMQDFSDKFSEVLVFNINKGREMGYYREDFDAEMYSKLFFQMVMSYDGSPFMDTESVDRERYMSEAMLFYLNAITTDKGKEILKNFKK